MKKVTSITFILLLWLGTSLTLNAANKPDIPKEITVDIFSLNTHQDTLGIGNKLGDIVVSEVTGGLQLVINLQGLPAGEHGFHMHENPACEYGYDEGIAIPGLSAGGHYDPLFTAEHLGPDGLGHMGDLPVLEADKLGVVQQTVIAPRLNLLAAINRSLVIHQYGDNYSDDPKPLGGGGARIACGVIKILQKNS